MGLPHRERRRWCEEISSINDRINRESRESEASSAESGTTPGVTLTQPVDFDE